MLSGCIIPAMQNTAYLIPWMVSATFTFTMGVFAYRRRGHFAAPPFIAMCFFATLWTFFYIFELGSTSLDIKFMAVKIEYIGIIGVPLAWTAFALAYSGQGQWLTKRNIALALIFPLITLIVVWTTAYHHWFFSEISTTTDAVSGLFLIWNPPSWWFWIHAVYIYGVLVFGTYFLLREYWHQRDVYRSQVVINIAAVLLPWFANGLVIFRLLPIQIDITSVTFSASILILGWGFFRYGLLDIAPVAHRAVFESISDAVIVLDPAMRIVELNPGPTSIGWPFHRGVFSQLYFCSTSRCSYGGLGPVYFSLVSPDQGCFPTASPPSYSYQECAMNSWICAASLPSTSWTLLRSPLRTIPRGNLKLSGAL